MVDGGRGRRLGERVRVLGFEDLRGYLQARCDTGYSIPWIATELGWGMAGAGGADAVQSAAGAWPAAAGSPAADVTGWSTTSSSCDG